MNILGSTTYTLNVEWQKKIHFLDQKHEQEDKWKPYLLEFTNWEKKEP